MSRQATPRSVALDDGGRVVVVTWRDGRVDRFGARALRCACPCARCVEEGSKRPLLDPAKVPADLTVKGCRAIGNYATQFAFADGHSTGLYTHEVLRAMAGG